MLLHVISRFVNREIRVVAPHERRRYLERVPRALEFADLQLHCYALMGNHVHWGVRAGHSPIGAFYKPLHDAFARWLNPRQGRLGPLFADRPEQYALDDERFAYLVAYIHNNPVRAGVVTDAADSDWTSHRAYIGDIAAPPWLDVAAGLALAGFDSSPSGRLAFHDFVRAAANNPRDPVLSGDATKEARAEVRAALRAPVEVGPHVGTRPHYSVLARPQMRIRPRSTGAIGDVLAAVRRRLHLTEAELLGTSRRRDIVAGRRLALIVWSLEMGNPQVEMAAALGISEPSASRLLSRASAVDTLVPLARPIAAKLAH